ncbi:hypothetical protein DPMN_099496 [Dreissena polymorpha]|uniref:Uncharacterized protein n=1 Tax=Dreissena polymorpha TaxID=45954 RepID=A0A9D4LHD3_DREPO|nr:hypothetical protein DPMN_099496 [Dreissena polymorpha]
MRGIKQAKNLLNAEQKSLLLLVASLLPNFSSGRSHFSLKFEPRLSPEDVCDIYSCFFPDWAEILGKKEVNDKPLFYVHYDDCKHLNDRLVSTLALKKCY